MALPANVTQTTVTGNLVWIDGSPAKGSVTFLPSIEYVLDSASNTNIYLYEVTEVLDEAGHFDVPLIATDDPDLNPTGWTYTVRILLTDPSALPNQHKPIETIFSMVLPTGPAVDIADVTPVQSSPGNAVIVGPKGDPGQVVSVNGKQGTVVLTHTDVGAEPLGATASMQAALGAHISDPTDAHDASAVSFVPTQGISSNNVQGAIAEDALDLANHIGSVGIVHAAGAVSFAPVGAFASTNVQSAIVEDAADLAAHLVDAVDAHDASAISVVPGGTIAATNVQTALTEVASDAANALTLHVNDTSDAHDASAISVVPEGSIAATTVQAALVEVANEAAAGSTAVQGNLTAHINDTIDAHDASAISFLPAAGIVAITVQSAIVEDAGDLAAHLVDTSAAHAASAVSFAPAAGIAATTVQAAIVEDAGDLAAHLVDTVDAHDASAISYVAGGSIVSTNVQAAIAETAAEAVSSTATVATNLANHINDTIDAHDASAVSFVPTGSIAATNVQAAIAEAVGEALGSSTAIADHINDTTDAHDASAISFLPTGSIAANTVQAAIVECANEAMSGQSGLVAHIESISDAHDATAVSFTPIGTIAATEVQGAIVEVSGEAAVVATDLAAHIADASAVHAATAISIVPLGAITSTDVQAAIYQVATETTAATAAVDLRVSDHINDTNDAHDASAISILDVGGLFTATDVEAAFIENRSLFNAHTVLTTTAHGGLVPPTRTLTTTAPLTGGGDLSANRTLAVSAATEAAVGVVELASTGEATAGTDQTRAVHAAGVKAALDARNIVSTARLINTTAPIAGGGALSGDLTLTLSDNGVTNAKLIDMATARIKGRVTTGTGDPEDLTGTQATTLLDTFTATLKGLVPPPTTATGKVLKDNGTWATVLDQTAGDARYVELAGDTMTGNLTVSNIMQVQGAVPTISMRNAGGGTIYGEIIAATAPNTLYFSAGTSAPMELGLSETLFSSTVPILLPADPASPLHAATKQYVDNRPDVPTSRTISTTAPLTGGGALTGNLTLAVSAASATATGVVELATTAEATAQVDTVRAVTPAGLADRVLTSRTITTSAPLSGGGDLTANRTLSITSATEALIGAVELATQAETDAGTDDARAVTPLKLAASIAAKTLTKAQSINTLTGTAHAIVLTDAGKLVILSNASTTTLTVPNEATVNFPIGTFVDIMRYGLGSVSVIPQSPVAIRATPSTVLRAQYSGATLVKIGSDEWSLVGDLT